MRGATRKGSPYRDRLIHKWVNAGVIEDGEWSASDVGAPQGASASPLLANIYLHYVLDRWVRQWRGRQAHGDVVIVRFADDFVAGFEHKADAEQFLADLRERFAKFGLALHPDKTRLIEFGRNAARDRAARGDGKPETFDFLGYAGDRVKYLKNISVENPTGSLPACPLGFDIGERCTEKTERPLLRERSRVAEDDGDAGIADLHARQQLGSEPRCDVLESQQLCVTLLDDDCSAIHEHELGEKLHEAPVDEAPGKIGEALAFDDSDEGPVELDAVVTGPQCPSLGVGLLASEAIGIVLAGVDEDGKILPVARPSPRHPNAGSRRSRGAR